MSLITVIDEKKYVYLTGKEFTDLFHPPFKILPPVNPHP